MNKFSGLPEAWGLAGALAGLPLVGLVLGWVLDEAAGTSPLFLILGAVLGLVSGAAGFYRALKGWSGPRSSGS